MGSAEARWGWRVVDGDGVGTVSASDLGPAYSSLVLPFPTTLGTRLRLSGVWLWLRLSFICLRLVLWLRISSAYHGGLLSALSVRRFPIVGLIMDTAAIRIVDPNGLSRVRSKRH
jgi:hypothetical protein